MARRREKSGRYMDQPVAVGRAPILTPGNEKEASGGMEL